MFKIVRRGVRVKYYKLFSQEQSSIDVDFYIYLMNIENVRKLSRDETFNSHKLP